MSTITIGGNQVNTIGDLPKIGEKAPDFSLTKTDLSDVSLNDLAGKKVVINIFPSVDTPVCSASVRKFNEAITRFPDAVVLCASLDLPFAHSRFCEAEGLKDVIPVSEMRDRHFGDTYGVRMSDGPLAGLLARAVVVIDENGTVIHSGFVKELKEEPDYETVLKVLKEDTTTAGDDLNVCVQTETAEQSRAVDMGDPCDVGRAG